VTDPAGGPRLPRRRVDLHRLPVRLQYLIAIVVAAAVMWLAWSLRATQPGPAWMKTVVLPIWTDVGLAVLCFLAIRLVVRLLIRLVRHQRP
jgi:hypothetical protein